MATKRKTSRNRFGNIRPRNNKFQASYKRAGKTFYGPHQFLTRTEARYWLNSIEQQILAGTWVHPSDTPASAEIPLFGDYARRHIELQTNSRGESLRKSVKANYYSYLERGLSGFCSMQVNEITKAKVDLWWTHLIAAGQLTTASKHYKLLHAVMERAITDELLAKNPCKVKGAMNAKTGKDTVALSMDQVGILAQAITPRYKVMVLVCANLGLRFGELAALQRSDLDLTIQKEELRYFVNVRRSVGIVNGQFEVSPPKTLSGYRTRPLSPALTGLLNDHLASLSDHSDDALVFPSANGSYLSNDVFDTAIKRALKKTNIPPEGVSAHSLRRAGATELANKTANLAEIQEFLGDSSPAAAVLYVKATTRSLDLADAMETGYAVSEKTP